MNNFSPPRTRAWVFLWRLVSGTIRVLREPRHHPASDEVRPASPEARVHLPTRASLLHRLRDLGDQESWRTFFETYWQLLYHVARKAGLADAEAQDVVQETVIAVARSMPEFRYDPARGSFKQWLLLITRRRLLDRQRRHYRSLPTVEERPDDLPGSTASLESPEPGPDEQLAAVWEEEWREHLLRLALNRVRQRVNPKHFQVFDYAVLQGWPVARIRTLLGLNAAQIYLAKHRVALAVKRAVQELESEPDLRRC